MGVVLALLWRSIRLAACPVINVLPVAAVLALSAVFGVFAQFGDHHGGGGLPRDRRR
jgi:hypothetical protein